jgi:hypothetical protein
MLVNYLALCVYQLVVDAGVCIRRYTVKNFYEIPGLILIKSSRECVKSFHRPESYCKFGYIPRKFFPFLRM